MRTSTVLKSKSAFSLWLTLVFCFLFSGFPFFANAEPESDRENYFKAAFILNISRFVVWPPEAFVGHAKNFLICTYRSNPFGAAFKSIGSKQVGERDVRIATVSSVSQSTSCNVLVVGANELDQFSDDSHPDVKQPLLTIADLTSSSYSLENMPAMVALVQNETRIGIEINLEKTRKATLQINAQLLKLARVVDD